MKQWFQVCAPKSAGNTPLTVSGYARAAMRTLRARPARAERGSAWLEIAIALAIVLPLLLSLLALFRSGASLVAGSARYGAERSELAELAARWQNEAASAWAIFTPARDVMGLANCASAGCREVDFFARDPGGSAHFWAWRYDAVAQTLQRYTYGDAAAPAATLVPSGPALAGITAFEAHRLPASSLTSPALHGYVPKDVTLNLGFPDVEAGNALTVFEAANASEHILREYVPATTPSGFDIVVGTFTPSPQTRQGRQRGAR